MKITKNTSLLCYNSFGIDVKADYIIEYESVNDLQIVLKSEIVSNNLILAIGSGSNLLFTQDFKGVILHSSMKGINIVDEDEKSVIVEVGSGEIWDEFVEYSVSNNWGGIENLSLIPGEIGASAVQNIGAYGVEIQDVILYVKTVEIDSGNIRTFSKKECSYGYRESVFKKKLKRKYIVTSVIFELEKKPNFKLNYHQLEEEVKKTGKVNLSTIRQTIINIRQSKLPDPKINGNAGSFFINPVISKTDFVKLQSVYASIPHYYVSETEEKIPAGWLIEQCGWKGKTIGNVGVHDKQALVIVNRGGASSKEIIELADQIINSVNDKFGILLQPEVNYI